MVRRVATCSKKQKRMNGVTRQSHGGRARKVTSCTSASTHSSPSAQ